MPYRKIPIVTGEIYHVYNRSIGGQPIFLNPTDYNRTLALINFYRYQNQPLRYSFFRQLTIPMQKQFLEDLEKRNPGVIIYTQSLMPNHFHLLLKQTADNAVSDLTRNLQHGYAKYFNTKYEHTGSVFQDMFQTARIETDEQFLHTNRYIHLNPVTSYLVKIEELEWYPWCSFKNYMGNATSETYIDTNYVLNFFKTKEDYRKFIFDQVDYQRTLHAIKHLTFE